MKVNELSMSGSSRKMHQINKSAQKQAKGGTVTTEPLLTYNSTEVEEAVSGEAIFTLIAREVKKAHKEVLIQTFAWDSNTPAVSWLKEALEEVRRQKRTKINAGIRIVPLRVYLLIDERKIIANMAFNGKVGQRWPMDAHSLGLISEPGLVEVYPATFSHNSLGGTHAKTVIIDNRKLIITGANFQSSNFGEHPALDGAVSVKGPVAAAAREDFINTWHDSHVELQYKDTPDFSAPRTIRADSNPSEYSVPMLFTTRKAQAVRSVLDVDNPQNAAINAALKNASKIVKIAIPNLNAPFIMLSLINMVQRGVKLELMLGHSFNADRESVVGLGGTNQLAVNALYSLIPAKYHKNLDVRWYSLDGEKPVKGNVAGISHIKFMAIDRQIVSLGNANFDVASTLHLHEANLLVDDKAIAEKWTDKFFTPYFERAVPATPSKTIWDGTLELFGYYGQRNLLEEAYTASITETEKMPAGFKKFHLSRPEGFDFAPGQYLEIASANAVSRKARKPAVVAISSSPHEEDLEVAARPSKLVWHSNYPLRHKSGDKVQLVGPLGTGFPLEQVTEDTRLLLIGAGSGITPILSAYRSLSDTQNYEFYYSTKTESEMLYKKNLKGLAKDGHFVGLTQEEHKNFSQGRVTDALKDLEIDREQHTLAFIAGPAGMVKDTATLLYEKGLSRKCIYGSLPMTARQRGPVYRGDDPALGLPAMSLSKMKKSTCLKMFN